MTDTALTICRLKGYPFVLRPEGGRDIPRCYAVLAEHGEHAGLWAWQGSPDRLAYRGDVDWTATGEVPTDANAVTVVHLVDGSTVEVSRGGACSSCGPMARWAGPDWSHVVSVRA